MRSISEMIVRLADLAEAEGRLLRAMTVRVATAIGIIIVAVGAFTAGVTLLLVAVYIASAGWWGAAGGAAFTGLLALGTGGLLAWVARRTGT